MAPSCGRSSVLEAPLKTFWKRLTGRTRARDRRVRYSRQSDPKGPGAKLTHSVLRRLPRCPRARHWPPPTTVAFGRSSTSPFDNRSPGVAATRGVGHSKLLRLIGQPTCRVSYFPTPFRTTPSRPLEVRRVAHGVPASGRAASGGLGGLRPATRS